MSFGYRRVIPETWRRQSNHLCRFIIAWAAITGLICIWGSVAHGEVTQVKYDSNGNLLAQTLENATVPQIVGQPQLQVVRPGALGSFFVVAADTRGLTYQWQFNHTNISGATRDALLLNNVGATNEGLYSVVLSNSSGSVTSAPAALMIDSDGDGLPDSWEIAHFGNLNQTTTGDFDHDGVSNLQEFLDGTDPANKASALFRLTIMKDGGSVQAVPSQASYTNGQTVTLTATALSPDTFHAWTGDVSTRSNPITLVMTNNKTVFAHFTSIDFVWINPAGGDWNVASNWRPNLGPGSNDNVIITTAATITVNSDADCANLTFGDSGILPTLSGTATLTVHGNCIWTAGTMNGNGRTVIATGGSLAIANPSTVLLTGRTLENGGTMLWTGAGDFDLSGGAVFTNRAGALFQVKNAASIVGAPGPVDRIDNAGTFRKSASTGTTLLRYNMALNNYGAVEIQSGTLELNTGGLNNGTIDISAGSALNLSGGLFTGTSSSITGAGDFTVSGAVVSLTGLLNVGGVNTFSYGIANLAGNIICTNNLLLISGGTVTFDGTGTVAPATLNLTGGALGGSMEVTVGNTMNWTAGTMNGTGRTIIPPGVTLAIANAGTVFLDSRTLENGGTMLWTGTGDFDPSAGAVITNRAGALFNVQGSATFRGSPGAPPRIDNAGTFRKTVSTGTTVVGPFYPVLFNNYGTVDIQSGTLFPASGGLNNGTITVPANTTLNLSGGFFSGSPGSSITGAGDLVLSGGTIALDGLLNIGGTVTVAGSTATLTGNVICTNNTLNISGGIVTFSGTGTVAPATLNLTGGTLDGSMLVTAGSAMTWTAGGMSGTGQTVIPPDVTLTIANPGAVYLDTRTLENGGTILWTGTADFDPSKGAVITNRAGALFNVQGSATFRGSPGAAPRIDNAGTFRKSVSTGTTFIGPFYPVLFNNYGTVDIQSGILAANSGYFSSSNSTLNCALWGTTAGATYGQLQVPGTVSLNGTVSVNLTNHYVPGTNDAFTILSAGAINGTFASFAYPSNAVSMVLSNTTTSEIVRVTGVTLQQTNPFSPAPGIISWWRAENDATDAIGTNNGVLTNGATFAAGKVGQSFLFDGTNAYVVIPDSPSLRPASVTLEAWVKIFSTNGTELIFAKPLGSGTLDSYGLALVNGVPLATICDANGFGTFISSTDPLALGQWYHLAYTFDGTTSQEVLYVNGTAVASANAGKSMDFDTHPLLLGADIENGVPSLFLNGQIDEASLYNRALEANEIASIYSVGSAGKQLGSAYQRWKLAHLKDADALDLGDPDGDGYPTLLEYGLALFPEVADPPGLPQMNLFDYGAGDKRLRTILHRDPTHNDVTIEVQGSSNLVGGWQSLAASTNGLPFQGIGYVGGDGAGLEIKTVEIRDSASITNAPQRFIRVKVTH